jgi:hydroxymethylglutaryl-CoA reductase
MEVIAAAGLANNFSALRSLIGPGIQQGHMRLHLDNILRQLGASPKESAAAKQYFEDHTVSHTAVAIFLEDLRNKNKQE